MKIKQAQKIYCVGIGGIGVSGLARLALGMGKLVAGSDIRRSEVTDRLEKFGIKILIYKTIRSHRPTRKIWD